MAPQKAMGGRSAVLDTPSPLRHTAHLSTRGSTRGTRAHPGRQAAGTHLSAAVGRDAQGRAVNWVRERDDWGEDLGNGSGGRVDQEQPITDILSTMGSLDQGADICPDVYADVEACSDLGDEIMELRSQVEDLRAVVETREDCSASSGADDVSLLRTQVDRLKAVVFKQAETIRLLQDTITAAHLNTSTRDPLYSTRPPVTSRPNSFREALPQLQQERESPPPPAQTFLDSTEVKYESQRQPIGDRRRLGGFDARFHSTSAGATPADFRVLPARIILVRHGESYEDDMFEYSKVPDPKIPLTDIGRDQARGAGRKIREHLGEFFDGKPYRVFFYTSPYLRSSQTFACMREAMFDEPVAEGESTPLFLGMREDVQLREQDFGNFQDGAMKMKGRAERKRFGRFFYRFPNGESGADLYDRITIFQDHLVRDINAGRFSQDGNLVLVTHGLALRVFLMRWFHWTVDDLLTVKNPPYAEPLILERVPSNDEARPDGPAAWQHTKALYRLTKESQEKLKGCSKEMCMVDSPLILSVQPPDSSPRPHV